MMTASPASITVASQPRQAAVLYRIKFNQSGAGNWQWLRTKGWLVERGIIAMPNLDYKWALFILLILAPSAYFVFTRNSEAPKGQWVSQYVGDCHKTAMRFRFGNDIVLTDGKDSQPFATDALYRTTSNGQLQMTFIQRKADRVLDVSILYDRASDRLTPKAISVNKGPASHALPPQLAENYTFSRC